MENYIINFDIDALISESEVHSPNQTNDNVQNRKPNDVYRFKQYISLATFKHTVLSLRRKISMNYHSNSIREWPTCRFPLFCIKLN